MSMNTSQATEFLGRYAPGTTLVREIYDDDEAVRQAIVVLIPNYEYPDISHLSIAEILRRRFDARIKVMRVPGTRSGYWRAWQDMDRPWIAMLDGAPLADKRGRHRRFGDSASARRVARSIASESKGGSGNERQYV